MRLECLKVRKRLEVLLCSRFLPVVLVYELKMHQRSTKDTVKNLNRRDLHGGVFVGNN